MKYLKFLVILTFLGAFALTIGCKDNGNDGPSAEELRLEKLSKTWNLVSATLDGDDRTANWTNFQLTVTASKTYSTSGSNDENVWPASGTFDFAGTDGAGLDVVNRSDGVTVNIDNITDTNFDLSFTFLLSKAEKGSRAQSIEGDWIFKFN